MAFGIDTLAALNDPNFNWANFKQWKGEWPQFVARYFGGNEDATFGEFAAFKTTTGGKCHYVVPAQASVVSNQQMTGNAGLSQGATDAATTIKNLNYFIQSGDLKIPPSNEVSVYLDVEENTDLSASYCIKDPIVKTIFLRIFSYSDSVDFAVFARGVAAHPTSDKIRIIVAVVCEMSPDAVLPKIRSVHRGVWRVASTSRNERRWFLWYRECFSKVGPGALEIFKPALTRQRGLLSGR